MHSFAEHLQLSISDRNSLVLNPESRRDAAIYIDFGRVLPTLNSILRQEPPVGLIQGEWGLGKSHTLAHARYLLANQNPQRWHVIHIELGGFSKQSSFARAYGLIMQHVLPLLEEDLRGGPEPGEHELSGLTGDAKLAIKVLWGELQSTSPDRTRLGRLRYWLQAEGPTPTQAAALGLGSRLKDGASPSSLVMILRSASRIHRRRTRRRFLLMLDEAAVLAQSMGAVGLSSFNEGIRSLVDVNNTDLGVLLGLYKTGADASVLVRSDTLQRLEEKIIDLPALESPEQIRSFIQNFWTEMSRVQLFTPEALAWFSERAISIGATRNQVGRLPPRRLLQLLDRLARKAWEEKIELPIPLEAAIRWLPSER